MGWDFNSKETIESRDLSLASKIWPEGSSGTLRLSYAKIKMDEKRGNRRHFTIKDLCWKMLFGMIMQIFVEGRNLAL